MPPDRDCPYCEHPIQSHEGAYQLMTGWAKLTKGLPGSTIRKRVPHTPPLFAHAMCVEGRKNEMEGQLSFDETA